MLVKCPKCHFEQPKDTYCAKCGIEMDAFKPEKSPMMKTVFGSFFFHLGLLIILAFAGYEFYLHSQQKVGFTPFTKVTKSMNNKSDKAEFNPAAEDSSTPPDPSTLSGTTQQPPSQHQVNPKMLLGSQTNPPMQSSVPTSGLGAGGSSGSGGGGASESAAVAHQDDPTNLNANLPESQNAPQKTTGQLTVKYLEIGSHELQNVLNNASPLDSSSAEIFAAKINKTDSLYKSVKLKSLDTATQKNFQGKNSSQWFVGAQDPETSSGIGLNIKVQLDAAAEKRELQGDIDILRTLIETAEGSSAPLTQKTNFTVSFEISPQEVILVGGLLPHKKPTPEGRDYNWMKESLLKVFFSNQFLHNESEFLLVFEFHSQH